MALSLVHVHAQHIYRLLHAHIQYIHIVCAEYQKAPVKALVQVHFPVYALSKHKESPYLKANRKKKWLSSQSCHFFIKNIFLASDIFMKMYRVSILSTQSIKLFQQMLWYKLISSHMHYICTYVLPVHKP